MMARNDDPLLRSARREARVVLSLAFAAMAYTVIYCASFGYGRDPATLTFVLGFPDWVFWGIVAPWTFCSLFAWWFAFGYAQDEKLADDPEEGQDA